MVYLHMKTTCKEVPIGDIIATGHVPFFTDLSENCAEFKGQKNLERFRLVYNGRILSEEDLKKITDNDSIRVILLHESKIKKPIDNSHRQKIDTELKTIAVPYSNPEDRRLHGFNHDFSLPDHVSKLFKAHPQLVFDSHFVSVLNDWYLFRAYCIRNSFREDSNRGMFKYTNPEFLLIFKELVTSIGARFGFSSNEQLGFRAQRPAAGAQPITQAFLQNALEAALAGVAMPPVAARPAAPVLPPAPTQAQPAQEPMQQGYEQQAATLRSYGFENDELILLALEQSNGDVQAAIEFLIELQN